MERLLTTRDVQKIVSLRRNALFAAIRRGNFPRPLRLNKRVIRWKESELEAYLASLPRGGGGTAA